MQLDAWAANTLANVMADLLAGARVEVFDGAGVLLAACAFADPPFAWPKTAPSPRTRSRLPSPKTTAPRPPSLRATPPACRCSPAAPATAMQTRRPK